MKFPEKTGSKNLIKLKAGESVRGVFRGEPHIFRQHWVNNRSVLCSGADTCPECKLGQKSSFRFRLNFITKENEVLVAKVFEQGWTVCEALRALNEGDYPLEKFFMKVTRHGQATNTTYSIIPVAGGEVTAEQEEKISKVHLNDLNNNPTPQQSEIEEDTFHADSDDIPF